MSSDLQITVSEEQGRVPITVFHVKGQVDGRNYEQLQTQASEAFEGGMRNLLLDLTEVTYMSSAGLRAIHAIFKMMQQEEEDDAGKSPHFKLVSPPPDILKVIKAVGFDVFLEFYNNLEEAVASF